MRQLVASSDYLSNHDIVGSMPRVAWAGPISRAFGVAFPRARLLLDHRWRWCSRRRKMSGRATALDGSRWGQRQEQRRFASWSAPFYEPDLDAIGCRFEREAQGRWRRVLGRLQGAEQKEKGLTALRGEVETPEAVISDVACPKQKAPHRIRFKDLLGGP